ncbi:MAG TPA: hypothetical protein PLL53_10640 [Saprospiraceae bacterium]|nr:hypothetical protein [Saprospiraceae bacterium]
MSVHIKIYQNRLSTPATGFIFFRLDLQWYNGNPDPETAPAVQAALMGRARRTLQGDLLTSPPPPQSKFLPSPTAIFRIKKPETAIFAQGHFILAVKIEI